MDPSIVKFLEDDEDESLHSGADVDAFSAALTRDIGGDLPPHPPEPHDAELTCQGSNPASQLLLEQWNVCTEGGNPGLGMQQTEEQHLQSFEQHHSQIEQANQDICVNEEDQITDFESSQHFLQEGYSHSSKPLSSDGNPSQTFETYDMKTTEKIYVHHHKQDGNQSSTNQQLHSTEKLNVQKSLASNEENAHSLQQLNIQQQASSEATNVARQMKNQSAIPFQLLMPILLPHLEKDRSMQLQTIFAKLRSNEVSKDNFLRVLKNIVGDPMLRQAAQKLQVQLQARGSRNLLMNPKLYSLQKGQNSASNQPHVPASTLQRQTELCISTLDNSIQKTREVNDKSDGKAVHSGHPHSTGLNAANHERGSPITSMQAVNKPPQHAQVKQSSFPMYGTTPSNFLSHPYPRPSVGAQAPSQRLQGQISQTRQALHAQGIAATQLGANQLMGMAHMPKYEIQSNDNESKRIHGGPLSSHILPQQSSGTLHAYHNKEQRSTAMSSMSLVKPEVTDQASELLGKVLTVSESSSCAIGDIEQHEQHSSKMGFSTPMTSVGIHTSGTTPMGDRTMQISSSTPLLVSGTTKTSQKKTTAGHKKSLEAPGTSPPSSKKQKTSGAFHDQSIDQLNDVTAVSGVNLREEEEQLLCAPKEESRATEASRRVLQEEEEKLVLQRGSLQKKLAEITSKCGLKSIGGDVERCLSMCVEERLRGLLSYLIKLSKQRVDIEKARHQFVVTSDVGRQILSINKKIKDDWDKKQAEEAEKFRKVNDAEGKFLSEAEDNEKDKDDGRPKAIKANKDDDDKMRTTAANVAARAAVGGDDMLSKWQLMAEQARQKREGLDGASSSSHSTKNLSSISMQSTPGFRRLEQLESEKKGGNRRGSRNQAGAHHIKVPHSISVKDVVAALEREPQMSKSSLLYRLYERKAVETTMDSV